MCQNLDTFVFFHSQQSKLHSASIPFILKYKPVATELLDQSTIGKISNAHDTLYDSCTLLVEFHGNGNTLMEQKIKEFEYGVSQFSRVIESTNDNTEY